MFKKIVEFFQPSAFRFHPLEFILPTSKPFGLDISDYSIEIILLEGKIENSKLKAFGRGEIEPGILENSKILKKEELIKCLKNLISDPKFGKIESKKLIFSLPESKSFLHTFEFPKDLKKSEISEFIKSEAAQTFPFPLNELYLDFQVRENKVLLIAAQKALINDYLEIFKICRLQPIALENESMSLARALIEEKEKVILIIDIGAKTTNLALFDENELRLSFSMEVAGNRFTKAISEKLKITSKEAEDTKKKIGLNPKEKKIFSILEKEVLKIIEEIKRIEAYFQQKTGKEIEKIILTGGSALLPRLPDYFSENLEKKVLIGDPWVKINVGTQDKKKYLEENLGIDPFFYSTAIGLALRGLEKNPKKAGINLIGD